MKIIILFSNSANKSTNIIIKNLEGEEVLTRFHKAFNIIYSIDITDIRCS